MATLRVRLESLAAALDLKRNATVLMVCLIDLQETNDQIDICAFSDGQGVLDLLNKLDRPGAVEAVVGIQLALPPSFNRGQSWEVVPVLDFGRAVFHGSGKIKDKYAYHTACGRIFADGEEIEKNNIESMRSIYRAPNAGSDTDSEVELHQAAASKFLSKLFNEIRKANGG